MTVSVTTDASQLDPAEVANNWFTGGSMSQDALDNIAHVQGSGCMEARISSGGGVGHIMGNHGSTNYENFHLFVWLRQSQIFDTFANGGVRLRIATNTQGNSDYGQWNTSGQDRAVATFKDWRNNVIDPLKPFQGINGTPPAITAVISAGSEIGWLTGNGKALPVIDEVKLATKVTVGGGTGGSPGTFQEISDNDETNGRGFVKGTGGAFFVNCGIEFGNSASASSEFADTNQSLLFEEYPVSGAFYVLRHIGNATGTNNFKLGTSTGSGVNQSGAGGFNIKAAGDAPFRIEVTDSNLDLVGYYGCGFIGPAALYDDQLRNTKVEDNGTGFTDITRNANAGAGTSNPNAMPTTQAAQDATYFGHDEKFYELNINLVTAKGGTWTGTWEYYNGSSWAALQDLTDGTSNYGTTGAQTVTFAVPDDWAKTTIDTDNRYWIRFRISSFTSSGTTPVIQAGTGASAGVTVAMAGDVRIEDSAGEFVSDVFVNMGAIRVRNGGFLKKSIIDSSLAPAKHAALDLGGADPSANTVRDLTIQNCTNGILLRGSGNVTYNFRNIVFAGNTNDVRVDWAGTVVDAYPTSSQDAEVNLNNTNTAIGQSFTNTTAGTLSRARFYIRKVASPTGNAVAKLYAINNAKGGGDDVPTGSPLATSDPVDVSTLPTSLAFVSFSFSDEFAMAATTDYVIVLEYTNGTAVNMVAVGEDSSTPSHGGNRSLFTGTWAAASGSDLCFDVYRDGVVKINILEDGSTPTIQNVNGHGVVVANTKTFTVTNIVAGSEVSIRRQSDNALLAFIESSSTSFAYEYQYVADTAVWIIAQKLTHLYLKQADTLENSSKNVPIQQRLDPDYLNP